MPDDPRVQALLDELLDQETTPDAVCRRCPELLPVVRARWQQICWARDELDALLPVTLGENGRAARLADQPLPELPGYEVDAVLGHGGMGIVFRARHTKLSRLVALKMTLTGSCVNELERERFRREAEAVAALRHANVVQIYDVGDLSGRPYFTMELMEGGSLAQRQAGAPLPVREAAALMATLAEAVHAAHQGGIVHRDLKPANILFTPDGTPKITDFGLARRLEGNLDLTLRGVPVGTPSYMAPEQARGQSREIGPAADVYALGAILYELLTGRPPFHGETPTETLFQALHHEPVPPRRLNRKVPRDLQTICLTCLQKEARHRYVTAAALADDLHRFLQGEAIAARPEVFVMRIVRRVCRQPVLAAAVGIAIVSTLAFAAGGLWLVSERSAKAHAAREDVDDMVRHLNASSWVEASAALDRANGRLGNYAPADLQQRIDQGARDLELAARLAAFHAKGVEAIAGGTPYEHYDQEFMDALRSAKLGTFDDDPDVVARQMQASDIRNELIAALDWYSVITFDKDQRRSGWALAVASRADADQSSWRRRARDLSVLKDKSARRTLIATRPSTHPEMIPLTAFELYVCDSQIPTAERLALLKQLYQAHPGDFWLNLRFGGFLRQNKMHSQALGYIQTATGLRPKSAIAHLQFGNVLAEAGRGEESIEQYQQALQLDPTTDGYHQAYVRRLSEFGRHDAAVEHLQGLLQSKPQAAFIHTELGHCALHQGREAEALVWFTKAAELAPTHLESQKALRDILLKQGKLAEMHDAWKAMLANRPHQYTAWYGYAELSLFLGREVDYLAARQILLTRFGNTTDARTAEQVSRLSLLLPASDKELAAAVALSERALKSNSAETNSFRAYFHFAHGLAQYRQGKFSEAIATMQGDAARVLGPAPRLVLAMALQQSGDQQQALRTLAAAVSSHDWRPQHAKNQDAWIYHVLRREAEGLILPQRAAFQAATYQPTSNDERLALVGICQFTQRTSALARIYDAAFAADPGLLEPTNSHWLAAARAAASAGCGRGADAATANDAERAQWRRQATDWLRQELSAIGKALDKSNEQKRTQLLQRLRQWQTDDDLAGLRDPNALETLPAEERARCLALWLDVQAALDSAPGVR